LLQPVEYKYVIEEPGANAANRRSICASNQGERGAHVVVVKAFETIMHDELSYCSAQGRFTRKDPL